MSFADVNGIRIHYEVRGDPQGRETVAFLNGVMASTSSWSYLLPVFESRGYRILLHDFRGQLMSDKPAGPYSFHQHAQDCLKLLEVLGIADVHLVGTSYGGEVGMRMAIDFPEVVRSLTVIDSVSELDELLRLHVRHWQRLAEKGDPIEFFWGMAPTCYGNTYLERNLGLLEMRAKHLEKVPPEFFLGQVELYKTFLADVTMTPELPKIKAPTLVVCGEDDIVKPVRFSRIIAREIPGAEFVIVPNCGHVTIFEQHGTLDTLLLGFILKHARPA